MANYGDAAVRAANLAREQRLTPEDAWRRAMGATFPNSVASQVKSCPKGAFLGLCEEGLVRGIPRGDYTRSQMNKQYAVNAVRALRRTPSLANDRSALWLASLGSEGVKQHNGQMDVVAALWTSGLILPTPG
jgi:hypothetical protein